MHGTHGVVAVANRQRDPVAPSDGAECFGAGTIPKLDSSAVVVIVAYASVGARMLIVASITLRQLFYARSSVSVRVCESAKIRRRHCDCPEFAYPVRCAWMIARFRDVILHPNSVSCAANSSCDQPRSWRISAIFSPMAFPLFSLATENWKSRSLDYAECLLKI
jgi:hypothetical protein